MQLIDINKNCKKHCLSSMASKKDHNIYTYCIYCWNTWNKNISAQGLVPNAYLQRDYKDICMDRCVMIPLFLFYLVVCAFCFLCFLPLLLFQGRAWPGVLSSSRTAVSTSLINQSLHLSSGQTSTHCQNVSLTHLVVGSWLHLFSTVCFAMPWCMVSFPSVTSDFQFITLVFSASAFWQFFVLITSLFPFQSPPCFELTTTMSGPQVLFVTLCLPLVDSFSCYFVFGLWTHWSLYLYFSVPLSAYGFLFRVNRNKMTKFNCYYGDCAL